MAQASAASFAASPLGHDFVLRRPLAKATANRCALPDCGCDIREHAREEVTDEQLLQVLNCQDDGKPSIVLPNELAVGSYKAALAICKADPATNRAVLNCAGQRLHSFLPATRKEFDRLRGESPPRLLDLEWEDSESFAIPLEDIVRGLAWMREHVAAGRMVVVNCAQGKSRSGTMAVAYVMAKYKLSVSDALARVRASRPLVDPNPTFVKALLAFTPAIHEQPSPTAPGEARLRRLFTQCDADASGGLNMSELRTALVQSGGPANEAKAMLERYDAEGRGELTVDEFVHAWHEGGLQFDYSRHAGAEHDIAR
mmetsp:Transcript_27193/g.81904  ORF Transcript_27193/g.81904 Transcript_27193/m.81904 type:complete len:313 (-) Transcript_27193:41-979(-)